MSAPARSGKRRSLRALALTLGGMSFVTNVVGLVFAYKNTQLLGEAVDWSGIVWGLWPVALVVVGVVVAAARPEILVGWGLLAAGFCTEVITLGGAYGGWARLSGAAAPLSGVAIWAGLVASGAFVMTAPLVVTCLPSGHPDTWAARILNRVSWFLGFALVGWWAFGGELLSVNTMSEDSLEPLSNPFAVVALSRDVTVGVTTALTLGLVVCFLVAIVLVLLRRRRASAVERAQLRWLAVGLLTLPAVVPLLLVAEGLTEGLVGSFVESLGLVIGIGAIPVSIAMSVLRFRLFEIDRMVSRTVGFSVVALVLGAVYASLAALPSLVIGGPGDTPSWLVAGSTLSVFALFSPLRRRVQRIVDRRFNRSRYDAERVIDQFSSQVREFTDSGTIASGIRSAVTEALQPARLAVWLREP